MASHVSKCMQMHACINGMFVEGREGRKGKEKGKYKWRKGIEKGRKGKDKGRKEEKRKGEKRRKIRKKEKEEREKKGEKEEELHSEQTRMAKNPELRYKR